VYTASENVAQRQNTRLDRGFTVLGAFALVFVEAKKGTVDAVKSAELGGVDALAEQCH
jgi:hypothetical protein